MMPMTGSIMRLSQGQGLCRLDPGGRKPRPHSLEPGPAVVRTPVDGVGVFMGVQGWPGLAAKESQCTPAQIFGFTA